MLRSESERYARVLENCVDVYEDACAKLDGFQRISIGVYGCRATSNIMRLLEDRDVNGHTRLIGELL